MSYLSSSWSSLFFSLLTDLIFVTMQNSSPDVCGIFSLASCIEFAATFIVSVLLECLSPCSYVISYSSITGSILVIRRYPSPGFHAGSL